MLAIYHQTLKKYTLAMLKAFNNIRIPYYNESGVIVKEVHVPIVFGNSDKCFKLDLPTKVMKQGNNYTLPRMALNFNSLTKASQRNTSKFSKITLPSKDKKQTIFSFNSVPYDFGYTIYIASRTLTEMMLLVETIAPLFRPTYTIPVYEIDIQPEPTNILVELTDLSLEIPEEIPDDETRIIKTTISLILRGNLYLPTKDEKTISKIRLYMDEILDSKDRIPYDFTQLEIDSNNVLNEFITENSALINQIKKNEGHKGW